MIELLSNKILSLCPVVGEKKIKNKKKRGRASISFFTFRKRELEISKENVKNRYYIPVYCILPTLPGQIFRVTI